MMMEKNEQPPLPSSADVFLDITKEVCPLTFVKTKLCLERMAVGTTLEVRLNVGEPLTNVPKSLTEQGYRVLRVFPELPQQPQGVHRLWVHKEKP